MALEAVVVVTNVFVTRSFNTLRHCAIALALLIMGALTHFATAAVLPEDRADILYHSYDGGGMTIDGPSILVRKSLGNRVSVWGNYYEDMISSASVDVVTQGSPYEEERTETSVGADFLNNKTLFSLSFTESSENDYDAETVGFAVSQDFFGDLTTISMNYSKGEDEIRVNQREDGNIVGADFRGNAEHQRYGLSWTQILTKNMIVSLTGETVVDEGFLNNPYRSVRHYGNSTETFITTKFEQYPTTRSSDAFALRGMYYLPYRAALKLEYRTFSDSWGITADHYQFKYVHPWRKWTFELKYRAYEQTKADFYSDIFTFEQSENQNFLASDKELDALNSVTLGIGVSYQFKLKQLSWFEKSSVNLYWDNIAFDYENYRDKSQATTFGGTFDEGEEPIYSFDANVIRLFLSFWY